MSRSDSQTHGTPKGEVTIYAVTVPWRPATPGGALQPEVTEYHGVRTAKQIKLDRSPGFGRQGGPRSSTINSRDIDRVHYTALDAVVEYRTRCERDVVRARELFAAAEEAAALASALEVRTRALEAQDAAQTPDQV